MPLDKVILKLYSTDPRCCPKGKLSAILFLINSDQRKTVESHQIRETQTQPDQSNASDNEQKTKTRRNPRSNDRKEDQRARILAERTREINQKPKSEKETGAKIDKKTR